MSASFSHPEAINCWLCNEAKIVLLVVDDFQYRACAKCDAPNNRAATWQQDAS